MSLITLTENAAARIRNFLLRRGGGFGLRLDIRFSGCAGMVYVLEFVDKPSSEDLIFEDKGIKLVINSNNLKLFNGIKLDVIKNGISENFKFTNPNIKNECGCGKSFNIE